MSVHITLIFDDHVEGFHVAAELSRRFPDSTEVDMVSDDEAADDIDLIYRVAKIVAAAETPEDAKAALTEMIPLWGKSNAAMQFIDNAVASLPEAYDSDPTPPHGIERPRTFGSDFYRPQANGTTPNDVVAKREVMELVACPRCGAQAGAWCFSKSTPSWGVGMMHAARIDLIDWKQS